MQNENVSYVAKLVSQAILVRQKSYTFLLSSSGKRTLWHRNGLLEYELLCAFFLSQLHKIISSTKLTKTTDIY